MRTFLGFSLVLLAACANDPAPTSPTSQATTSPSTSPTTLASPSASPSPSTSTSTSTSTPTPTTDPAATATPWGAGDGDAGATGGGFGNGHGRLGGGSGSKKTPSIRAGAIQVNGRLPPEAVQRVLRQNFGKFRLCYETLLATNEKAEGRVSVKLVIDKTGAVSTSQDGGSDIGDATMISCVVRAVGDVKFPQPEGGIVTVVYPLVFSPGE